MMEPPAPGEVHLWQVGLAPASDWVARLEACLCPGEIIRANSFALPSLRRRFVVGRGSLRHILGNYLGQDPQTLALGYEPAGKPFITFEPTRLGFNLSHSGDLAIIALAQEPRIGVDLEFIDPELEIEEIAHRFFHGIEFAALMNIPAPLRRETFFNYWTCKEAYLKGIGAGLSRALHDFAIALSPPEPPRLLEDRMDGSAPARWKFVPLTLPAGLVGTVAVECFGRDLKLISFALNHASGLIKSKDS